MKRLLFVCTANIQRSPTAERLYKTNPRFDVRSAGISPFAKTMISRDLLEWADYIIVMEKHQQQAIRKSFTEIAVKKKIFCFDIPDEYDYMSPELQYLIKEKMSDYFGE